MAEIDLAGEPAAFEHQRRGEVALGAAIVHQVDVAFDGHADEMDQARFLERRAVREPEVAQQAREHVGRDHMLSNLFRRTQPDSIIGLQHQIVRIERRAVFQGVSKFDFIVLRHGSPFSMLVDLIETLSSQYARVYNRIVSRIFCHGDFARYTLSG